MHKIIPSLKTLCGKWEVLIVVFIYTYDAREDFITKEEIRGTTI